MAYVTDDRKLLISMKAEQAPHPSARVRGFQGLDHVAIVVPDTDSALALWRDTLGLKVLYSEDVNGGTVN